MTRISPVGLSRTGVIAWIIASTVTVTGLLLTLLARILLNHVEPKTSERSFAQLAQNMTVVGVVMSLLVGALVLVLAAAQARARRQAIETASALAHVAAEARERGELLDAVMRSIGDGVMVVDHDSKLLLVNQAARRMVGMDDPTGGIDQDWRHRLDLYQADDTTPFPLDELPTDRALKGQMVDDVEMVIRRGHEPFGLSLSISARPLQLKDGGPPGAVAVLHDRTERRQAEDQVRASEEHLRLLMDGARDYAIFMLDDAGLVASWSPSAHRLIGYTETEIIGRRLDTFFTTEDVVMQRPLQVLREARETGRAESDGLQVRMDGSLFWAHATVTVLRRSDGSLQGYVKVLRDTTARHQAETKFRDLLEAAPDAMLGVGPHREIMFVNARAEEMFGYERADLLQRTIDELLPETLSPEQIERLWKGPEEGSAHPAIAAREINARLKDGTEFPADISLSSLDTEAGPVISVAVRDVTDRRQAQQAIEKLNADLTLLNQNLEVRVAERTIELEERASELRQVNAELEAFSYSVSHDLRAPLRAVDGFANMLALDCGEALDAEGRRYLGKIREGAKRMSELIDGLLTFSRLQRQAMAVRPVDITCLFGDVWEDVALEYGHRKIDFTLAALPRVCGDPNLLRHVVSNLLSNAAKYSECRAIARINVDFSEEADRIVYRVQDNGAGFDMQYIDKLFQVFQRLHRAEDFEGTGIGLALAARVIHRHNGEIWATAEPDHGATFFFSLPKEGTDRDDGHESR